MKNKSYFPKVENVGDILGFKEQRIQQKGDNINILQSFGYLECMHNAQSVKVGQGVLIGPFHVLTSARVISQLDNEENKKMLDKSTLQFTSCNGQKQSRSRVIQILWNLETIRATNSFHLQDVALCLIDMSLGNTLGHLGVIAPLKMTFFDDIQFNQNHLLIADFSNVIFGNIFDIDKKNQNLFIQFIGNNNNGNENIKNTLKNSQKNGFNIHLNKIVYFHDSVLGNVVVSLDCKPEGLYHSSQFLSTLQLSQIVYWFQGDTLNPIQQIQPTIEIRYLENKEKIKVEERANQGEKGVRCLKQLNNQFVLCSNEEGSANFWHVDSLNIGFTLERDVLAYNYEGNTFSGIDDIACEGYFGIALVGRFIILLNWHNFELLEAKEFRNKLTCIEKLPDRYSYAVGDSTGNIIHLTLHCDTMTLTEDLTQTIQTKNQGNVHGHEKAIEKIHVIHEKDQILVGSHDGIRIWDMKTRKLHANIEGEQKYKITFLALSGTHIYVSNEDKSLRIHEINGQLLKSIRFLHPIVCAVFLNNQELALSEGKSLKIFNISTNQSEVYSVHKQNITHICRFSDSVFLTADTKGTIFKWTQPNSQIDLQNSLLDVKKQNTLSSNYPLKKITQFFSSRTGNKTTLNLQKLILSRQKANLQKSSASNDGNKASLVEEGSISNPSNKQKVRDFKKSTDEQLFYECCSLKRSESSTKKEWKDSNTNNAEPNEELPRVQQKIKEQELKGERKRNGGDKNTQLEKKIQMEKNVDAIKLTSHKFESQIPLIQNDLDALRKQVLQMNERLSDRQIRIRERSSSLQRRQTLIQQCKADFDKQQKGQDNKGDEQQTANPIDKDEYEEDEDCDDQVKLLSYELEQSLMNSRKLINNQYLNQQNKQNKSIKQQQISGNIQESNIEENGESIFKSSMMSPPVVIVKNDELVNSFGSNANGILKNNKLSQNQAEQARNLMKKNREEEEETKIDSPEFKQKNNISPLVKSIYELDQISNPREFGDQSYKYANRRSSQQIYQSNTTNLSYEKYLSKTRQEEENDHLKDDGLIDSKGNKIPEKRIKINPNIEHKPYPPSPLQKNKSFSQNILIPTQTSYNVPNPLNGPPNPLNGTPNRINGAPSPLNGTPSSLNGAPSLLNGAPSPLNGAPSTLNGAPSLLNGAPSLYNGAPSTLNGAPSPLNGAPNPLNGAPSPLKGAPSPLKGAPSPLKGTPNPSNSAPSPLKGAPSPSNGGQIPQNGIQLFKDVRKNVSPSQMVIIRRQNNFACIAQPINTQNILQTPPESQNMKARSVSPLLRPPNENQFNISTSPSQIRLFNTKNQVNISNGIRVHQPHSNSQQSYVGSLIKQLNQPVLPNQISHLQIQSLQLPTHHIQNSVANQNNQSSYLSSQTDSIPQKQNISLISRNFLRPDQLLVQPPQQQHEQSEQTIKSFQQDQISNYEQEKQKWMNELKDQAQLIKDLQGIMQKQESDLEKKEEQNRKLIEQQEQKREEYEQNLRKLTDQVTDLTNQTQRLQSTIQKEKESNTLKTQLLNEDKKVGQLEQSLKDCAVEDVDRLTKQVIGLERLVEQQKTELKSLKNQLQVQEKILTDLKRIENEQHQFIIQNQKLRNENNILQSKFTSLEDDNKRLLERVATTREEVEGKYNRIICEFKRLMKAHSSNSSDLLSSIEFLKNDSLSSVDFNYLDKLIQLSLSKNNTDNSHANLTRSSTPQNIQPFSKGYLERDTSQKKLIERDTSQNKLIERDISYKQSMERPSSLIKFKEKVASLRQSIDKQATPPPQSKMNGLTSYMQNNTNNKKEYITPMKNQIPLQSTPTLRSQTRSLSPFHDIIRIKKIIQDLPQDTFIHNSDSMHRTEPKEDSSNNKQPNQGEQNKQGEQKEKQLPEIQFSEDESVQKRLNKHKKRSQTEQGMCSQQ